MKVAVYLADQNPHRDRTRGITNLTHCLLIGLAQRPDVQLLPLVSASSYSFVSGNVQSVRLPWRTDNPLLRLLTDHGSGPAMNALRADVAFYPKGYVPCILRPRCPVVGTVHDTILQFYADHYPRYRSRLDMAYWLWFMKASLRHLDMILTDSCVSRTQILEFCARYRISPPPVRVTYAASNFEDVPGAPACKKDYVVHLCSQAPHKKTRRLMELWSQLVRARTGWPDLCLVGSSGVAEEFLGPPGVFFRHCPDDQAMSQILREARAVIVPSCIEGFGLPALEGYFHGTPVCFVRNTSIDEIVSPFTAKGGFFLDDPDSFRMAIESVLAMSAAEVEQVREGLRARFSKQNFVNAVALALQDAARGTRGSV